MTETPLVEPVPLPEIVEESEAIANGAKLYKNREPEAITVVILVLEIFLILIHHLSFCLLIFPDWEAPHNIQVNIILLVTNKGNVING